MRKRRRKIPEAPKGIPTRAVRPSPGVEILVASRRWRGHRGVARLLRRAIASAAAMVPTRAGELAIVLTDDSAMRALNRTWRRKDAPTMCPTFLATGDEDHCGE